MEFPVAFRPLPGETAEEYNERFGTVSGREEKHARDVLEHHFGIPEDELKGFMLTARSFWIDFITRHITSVHERGGTRYAAIKFAQKKVDWPIEEIEELVDSVWK